MNERIRQLKQQARDFYLLQEDLDCSTKQLHELVEAKFAELIVQECVSLAKSKSEYIQSMETDDRGDQMQIRSLAWQFEEFGYKIKKHFGVE